MLHNQHSTVANCSATLPPSLFLPSFLLSFMILFFLRVQKTSANIIYLRYQMLSHRREYRFGKLSLSINPLPLSVGISLSHLNLEFKYCSIYLTLLLNGRRRGDPDKKMVTKKHLTHTVGDERDGWLRERERNRKRALDLQKFAAVKKGSREQRMKQATCVCQERHHCLVEFSLINTSSIYAVWTNCHFSICIQTRKSMLTCRIICILSKIRLIRLVGWDSIPCLSLLTDRSPPFQQSPPPPFYFLLQLKENCCPWKKREEEEESSPLLLLTLEANILHSTTFSQPTIHPIQHDRFLKRERESPTGPLTRLILG